MLKIQKIAWSNKRSASQEKVDSGFFVYLEDDKGMFVEHHSYSLRTPFDTFEWYTHCALYISFTDKQENAILLQIVE